MSKTKIEWADRVWNPVTGCTKISEGCRNCYAERMSMRFAEAWKLDPNKPFEVRLHPERMGEPLRWKKPQRIFICSMSDLFHDDVPDEFIARVWWVMGQCAGYLDPSRYRGHTFIILTKRPKRMKEWLRGWADEAKRKSWIESFGAVFDWMNGPRYWSDILPNVWLGVSAENQAAADERIPLLLQTPAAVRFVSVEPMLGPIDLTDVHYDNITAIDTINGLHGFPKPHVEGPRLDWVICGGESGQGARPMHPDWARSLRDQCQAAEVPFFFKQWGEWSTFYDRDKDDPDWDSIPRENSNVRRLNLAGGRGFHGERVVYLKKVGKKAAGCLLDGREWKEFPSWGVGK